MTEGEGIAPIRLEIIAARIVTDAPDAILYTDREGIIRLWNGGCERIFGFTTTEATNQTFDIVIPENPRQRHWRGQRVLFPAERLSPRPTFEPLLPGPRDTSIELS